jgi:DNA-binding SARP family transcriptional activator/pimeloyl-ACP methyl ester carboxylesterase
VVDVDMLCLLGPAATLVDGARSRLKLRPKSLALLARLALADGAVPRQELAHLLFPDADNPRAALRWHLLDLRRNLPPELNSAFEVTHDQVGIHAESDVRLFRSRCDHVIAGSDGNSAEVLSLYHGDLCEGLTVSASLEFDAWLFVEQDALRRRFRQATLALAGTTVTPFSAEMALPHLSRLLSVDPYCEDAHVALIDALETCGRPSEAKEAYRRYEHLLREDLDAEPRPEIAARYSRTSNPGRRLPIEGPVPLDAITLHVVEWPGPEPAVLAIHGSGGSGHSLTALAERLSGVARFLAPDLRGNGFSDKPPHGNTFAQHVADVVEVSHALGLERPILLGFSFGGTIAAAVANKIACRGLILLEGVIGSKAFFENAVATAVPHIAKRLDTHYASFSEYVSLIAALPPSDDAERILKQRVAFELAPLSDGSFRRRSLTTALTESWASAANEDTLSILAKVRCPVLVVQARLPWIAEQPYLNDEAIADQINACPHALLYVAANSNHPRLIGDPEPGLMSAIEDFVRECGTI